MREGVLHDLIEVFLEIGRQGILSVLVSLCLVVHDVGQSTHDDHQVLALSRDVRVADCSQQQEELLLLQQRAPLGLCRLWVDVVKHFHGKLDLLANL